MKKYNLLLVDDEQIVLDGLEYAVDWESFGFELVGKCNSIKQALELMSDVKVDVILTDIVMNQETGFDLISQTQEEYPNIKFVILSGHNEFDYALKALDLGCVNFLTKPLDFSKCEEVFSKIYEGLIEDEATNEKYLFIEEIKKTNSFRYMSTASRTNEKERLGFEKYLDGLVPKFGVVLLHCETDCLEDVLGLCETHLSGCKKNSFTVSDTEACIFLWEIEDEEKIIALNSVLNQNKSENCYISCSSLSDNADDFTLLFRQANICLNFRCVLGAENVLRYDEISKIFSIDLLLNDFEENVIRLLIFKENLPLVNYIKKIIAASDEIEQIYAYLIYMVIIIANFFKDNDYKTDYDITAVSQKILSLQMEECVPFAEEFIRNSFSSVSYDTGNFIVSSAKAYIDFHFCESITLKDVAAHIYISHTYLSKLFYKSTGKHFIEYLTSLRMEKAKELMGDVSLKIYDIAALVGYESTKHFNKIFKEYTSFTPKEYRNGALK